jgi:leader peptidase (prepilin peptidase)/N-methyltransferase
MSPPFSEVARENSGAFAAADGTYTQSHKMIRILGTVFGGLVGLAFGSFLNVCLSRWPEGESVVKPRSHCRNCGRPLAWWENLPLVSWLGLLGHCRTCKTKIGWRYPLVELGVGTLWATISWQTMDHVINPFSSAQQAYPLSYSPNFLFQIALALAAKLAFSWTLVGLAALDVEHLWLPDIVTTPGIVLGVSVTLLRGDFLLPTAGPTRSPLFHLLHIAFAILAAASLVLLIRWAYWMIRHREGIGLGDAKLMAMLAAWLGLPGALLAFVIGILLGALTAIVVLLSPNPPLTEDSWALSKLPLGTFLCIGGVVSGLWGQPIITAYLRWSGLA